MRSKLPAPYLPALETSTDTRNFADYLPEDAQPSAEAVALEESVPAGARAKALRRLEEFDYSSHSEQLKRKEQALAKAQQAAAAMLEKDMAMRKAPSSGDVMKRPSGRLSAWSDRPV